MIDNLVAHLKLNYEFDNVYNLSEFLRLPSASLSRLLADLKQPEFANNYRIVFYNFNNVDISDVLAHLQECLTFLDIPNFFVLVVSNDSAVESLLTLAQWQYSTEQHPIGFKLYDTPVVKETVEHTALLSVPASICAQPWISLDVDNQGGFAPCCFFNDVIKRADGSEYNASTHTLEEVYNSEYMRQLREAFRQGIKPKECVRCWNEESDGIVSKRQLLKNRFSPLGYQTNWEQDHVDNLSFVSVAFGNACNLKCRICNPDSSSSIATELLANNIDTNRVRLLINKTKWVKDNSAAIWDSLSNSNVLHFDFAGGEPLLSIRHYDVLKDFIAQHRSKDISLRYNTNGTVFPDKYADLWQHFKQVDIDVSIDNIEQRFEFERSNASWSEVVSNLDKFFQLRSSSININLHLAVSLINVYYIPEICEWVNQQPFDHVHFSTLYYPECLNISQATNVARELILDKLEQYTPTLKLDTFVYNIVNILKHAVLSDGHDFCVYMKQLDQFRNENFAKLYPEMAKAMGY